MFFEGGPNHQNDLRYGFISFGTDLDQVLPHGLVDEFTLGIPYDFGSLSDHLFGFVIKLNRNGTHLQVGIHVSINEFQHGSDST